MKVSRSLKWIKGANIRTRKLARDMLLLWKRVDKEMVLFNSFMKFLDFVDLIMYACLVNAVYVMDLNDHLNIVNSCVNEIIEFFFSFSFLISQRIL